MKRYLTWSLMPVLGLLASCATYAPEERSELNTIVPPLFSLYSEATPDVDNRWWVHFQSDELNAFIGEALTNSPSIQQAWARLMQADAVAARIGADRSPALSYEAGVSASRDSITKTTEERVSLGLNAAYEVDLWGRIRSQTEAALLDRDASREQLQVAAITLAARTAQQWASIIAQRLQIELLNKQLEANRSSLELIELRYRKSGATVLDVYQQRRAVSSIEAALPQAELREALLRHEMTALLGRTNFQTLKVHDAVLPEIAEVPAIGIPVDVLANRPDVRLAGLNLAAADWRVSAARADRLPAIRLTASANVANSQIADLFSDWFANLAASVTGPIFEAGRRKAEVARTRAVVDERLAAYRETVINAIKEVEDALVSEQMQRATVVALERNIALRHDSYEEALNRYRNGLSEYLTVLVERVELQTLERDCVVAQYALLQYRIDLYRALGGAWPDALETASIEREDP